MEARPITRVTVIGLGSIGSRHARNLRGMGVSVTGFDPDIQRRATATASGITTFPDRESALAVADAAIIASPTPCHIDDLAAAIEANCHALVEKPLGHRSDLRHPAVSASISLQNNRSPFDWSMMVRP